ncbi:MAG TPA: glutamate-cysteine ligase family protein [Candidatus Hydrogenedentes bacterium]|nr:glutamate-cysteine ligase family protein [Candidatus Hydrogenedentota bacterium]
MSNPRNFHLFERFGIELEYMIVDAETLDVMPVTDEVLKSVTGEYVNEFERGPVTWSNELVLHVIELKSTQPLQSLDGAHVAYQENVRALNALLAGRGACLMPTAMHPWMDPFTNTRLWPHGNNEIYDAFNAIFDCRGHGWSNLQSVHLNLPFANDEEFARLHAAIRILMPIMPALAASSPIMELKTTGILDNRMEVYRTNSSRIPLVTGLVIPEPVFSAEDYQRSILQRLYHEIAPHDPEGILQEEWLNARGAIARFERNTIEVRVLDVQECPAADLAIVSAITAALRALSSGHWISLAEQQKWATESLHEILLDVVHFGEKAVIRDEAYLRVFGASPGATAGEVWRLIAAEIVTEMNRAPDEVQRAFDTILTEGTLSTRILNALDGKLDRPSVKRVYEGLCNCLAEGLLFYIQD